jgi:hypothetical protein
MSVQLLTHLPCILPIANSYPLFHSSLPSFSLLSSLPFSLSFPSNVCVAFMWLAFFAATLLYCVCPLTFLFKGASLRCAGWLARQCSKEKLAIPSLLFFPSNALLAYAALLSVSD